MKWMFSRSLLLFSGEIWGASVRRSGNAFRFDHLKRLLTVIVFEEGKLLKRKVRTTSIIFFFLLASFLGNSWDNVGGRTPFLGGKAA